MVVIGVCLAVLAGALVGAVRVLRWRGSVTVLASWTGGEERAFRTGVLDPFQKKYRIHVSYQGSSALSQVLAADAEAGTPPDVAVLPGPGELADYAHQGLLRPLDGLIDTAEFGATWVPRVPGGAGVKHYWVPVKADLKSMVWYPAALSTAADRAAAAGAPGAWCLGMGSGATSGWPGTDWVEDVLLQQNGPKVYDEWATGQLSWQDPRVRRAFTTYGEMVGADRDGYAEHALTTDFDQAAKGVSARGPGCRLEHQSTVVRGETAWQAAGPRFTHSTAFIPHPAAPADAWEVSGDLAGLLSDSPAAKKLIRYLASDTAQRAWIDPGAAGSPGFSADTAVPVTAYPRNATDRAIAATLADPSLIRCYDASDAMPTPMRDAFNRAVLRFLAASRTLAGQLATLDTVRTRQDVTTWLPSVCGGL